MQFTLEEIKQGTFFAMVPRDVRNLLILYYDPIALFEWQCDNGMVACDGANLLTEDIQEFYLRKKHEIAGLTFDKGTALDRLVRKMLNLLESTRTQRKKELVVCFLFNNILLKAAREHFARHVKLLDTLEQRVMKHLMTAPPLNPLFAYYRPQWRDFIAQCYVFVQ